MASGTASLVMQLAKAELQSAGRSSNGSIANRAGVRRNLSTEIPDDLSREVYCLLGLPLDAVDMATALQRIEIAAARSKPFVVSTPNVNFLVALKRDPEFRDALMLSDLCTPDGMPIVWMARLIGLPIKQRVAGSDMVEALRTLPQLDRPLRVFLFGATEEVAAAAAKTLNASRGAVACVGWICPGFGTVDELSAERFLNELNSADANCLMISVGAKKGQLWLQRNHDRLRIPVRAQFGATINFQAGAVKRAPTMLRKYGLEWAWRIKEEPALWRRYWNDGLALLRLTVTRVIPLAIAMWRLRRRCDHERHDLAIAVTNDDVRLMLHLSGFAVANNTDVAVSWFRRAINARRDTVIDCARVEAIDLRFFGLILMFKKRLMSEGATLTFTGLSKKIERMFQLNGLEHLLLSGRVK